jgi:hypothetical protein
MTRGDTMEIELARATVRDLLRAFAHDGQDGTVPVLAALDAAIAPGRGYPLELYSMSQDWAYIDSIKVIKCRGARGDLLIHLT